ncbi:MAG: glycoside hydrolase family 16 protein [Treponema sp.]|nr:glycoside hydrolase family 16 protein [Treponema sp.]
MRILKALSLAGLSLVIFSLSSCGQKDGAFVPDGYTLVWSDEFNTDGAPDNESWDYSLGGGGWGNAEIQKYTDSRDNSFIKDGHLAIVALKEGSKWTSARLKTQFKKSWTYGYFEIKAKLPSGVGTWPAIWMMPEIDKHGGWPRSGEIDIMEAVGFDQDRIHTTAHTSAFNHKKNTQKNNNGIIKDTTTKYHIYAVEWTEDYIQWFIDGEPFYKFEKLSDDYEEWPFDHNFYLILNIAIGGSWGGQEGIASDLERAEMDIDYVRVYQKQ